MNDQEGRQVTDRLELLEDYQVTLREIAGMSVDEVASNPFNMLSLERVLQIAAQACIDIGNYLAASHGWRSPKHYADVFKVMKEQGVLEVGLADRMAELAKLRNILVHLYLDVDINRLHAALRTGVDDFRLFSEQVLRFVEADRQ